VPEGDTIHKIAGLLEPLLVGRSLVRVTTQGLERSALAGQAVTAVRAVGKHLVIATADGSEIRTHLGMYGRWKRYAPGQAPPMSPGRASLVLATGDDVLVCTQAREVEIADRRAPRRGVALRRLGPDVLADDFDPAAAAARARGAGHRPIGDVLLDQQVAAGIGNVYRCEVLFLEGVHPSTPVAHLDDDKLVALYARARLLMSRNLGPAPRATLPRRRLDERGRYWVYRRAGLPCARCQAPIASRLVGEHVRRAYWCPRCQPGV